MINFLKGGDFMEYEGVYRDIEEFEVELGRRGAESPSVINPVQAVGSGDIVNSRFPERAGRIKPDPTLRGAEEGAMATGREAVLDQPQ